MSLESLLNQIATIIVDVHGHLYSKEVAFDKIQQQLSAYDVKQRPLQLRSKVLTAESSDSLEDALNDFMQELTAHDAELIQVQYVALSPNHEDKLASVLVVYKSLA